MIQVVSCFALILAALVAAAWAVTEVRLRRFRRQREQAPAGEQPEVDQLGLSLVVCIAMTNPNKRISDREWREFCRAHGLRARRRV